MSKHDDTAGLVLAGGQARRMGGEDKGLIQLNGQAMITYIITAMQPQVHTIMINANRNIADYAALGYPIVEDDISGFQGPLAGIASGLAQCGDLDYIATAPCDGPFLSPHYVDRLHAAADRHGSKISVAFDGTRLQPVYALIHKDLLPSLLTYLASGERKIDLWYALHDFAQADFSDSVTMFTNINTPQDLQDATRNLENHGL